MGLNLGENEDGLDGESLFQHNRDFEEGVVERGIRPGQATIVVALDGSGDAETIQEGINLLPSTGGVVFIKEGNYTITAKIEITINNVRITGTGNASQITMNASLTRGIEISASKTKINIDNIRITGANATARAIMLNASCTDCIIRHCVIDGALAWSVWEQGSGNIITNMIMESDGIKSLGTECIITNNQINNAGNTGVDASGANSVVANNQIIGASEAGIVLTDTFIRVIGNYVFNGTQRGIELINADRCIVTGNVSIDNDEGLKIDGDSDKNIITSNIVFNNTTSDITDAGAGNIVANNIQV